MLGFVGLDVDVVEACVGQMQTYLIWFIGVHALDEAFPFGIHWPRAVRLIDDDELSAWFQHPSHLTETMLNIRPEINGLEGCNLIKGVFLKRKVCDTGFPHFAATFGDGFGVYLRGFLHRDG